MFNIIETHPRIWLTEARLAALRAEKATNTDYLGIKDYVDTRIGAGDYASILAGASPETTFCRCVALTAAVSEDNTYINYAKKSGIADHVVFTGPLTNTAPYYKSFDLYVHPAYFEEFGLTVQEGLACGVPVITTSTTGASELFRKDMNDLILKNPRDVQKLTTIIMYLMKNAMQRKKLSHAAASLVTHNTWENYFSKVAKIYHAILKPPHKK